MIIVAVEIVLNENQIKDFHDVFRVMEEKTRKEKGCIEYSFSVDITDPKTMRVYERWDSTEDLRAHFETEHMKTFKEELDKIKPEKFDVKVYEISKEVDVEDK